ncbi:MAG: hypothetical protein GF307_12070 [candidate division Zixibacteria bacterium]|nr:hypothetical protein [candidate division Zixibacteria bacterium]
MNYRDYDPNKDKEAVHRLWQEVGWEQPGNPEPMDYALKSARVIVCDIDGQPECMVYSWLGDIAYLDERLSFSGIASVATGLVARRRKLAGPLTAARVALDALDGAEVCGLCMFEQGFYDRLGFGTGGYEHVVKVSPSSIKAPVQARTPARLDKTNWKEIFESRLNRMRTHGTVSFNAPDETRGRLHWGKAGMGFGYFDDAGNLSHHLWLYRANMERGPFRVWWFAYQNYEQFFELMALLKSFGDQVKSVVFLEPPAIQAQDLISRPFHYRQLTDKSNFENTILAYAYWQLRILDLFKCMRKTHLYGGGAKFNLILQDPIDKFLNDDVKWRGISGDYVITLGEESDAEKGSKADLPVLKASVGAFTRMWYGIKPATVLAAADDLKGPRDLLVKLDRILCLPEPKIDWEF